MKKKLQAIFTKLGLVQKAKDNKLSSKDWQNISASFKEEYKMSIEEALEADRKETTVSEEYQEAILALVGTEETEETTANPTEEIEDTEETSATTKPGKKEAKTVNLAGKIKELKEQNKKQAEQIEALSGNPEDNTPEKIEANKTKSPKIMVIGSMHTKTHVFGIASPFYSRDKWWNDFAATKDASKRRSQKEVLAFKEAFGEYGESLSARISQLHELGSFPSVEDVMAGTIDYSDFDNTGWGDEYVVRRQDALIAYLRTLPNVSNIFPVQYGVQNKQVMTNSFFEEFSQAWIEGRTFKGGYKHQPMEAKVDDVQFKHLFSELKKLEKEYLGYLNREGSQPIKWSFIEWLMARTIEVLNNEKNSRRIRGRRIEPASDWDGKGNPFLFASDGILTTIFRTYVDEFRLLPFADLNLYTAGNIVAYVESFVEKLNQLLDIDLSNLRIYMNAKHVPWYLKGYETTYGVKLDYTGAELRVKHYSIGGITAIPNMKANDYRMFITIPGNVELYENERGEMERIYFERELESLIAASWHKEGSGAYMVGRKYASKALLEAAGRGDMYIFLNDPFVALADGATTIDGSLGEVFKTADNTNATAITDITNAERGVVYRIECGATDTNVSTIAKAGKFSEISAAWTPTAVGDFIEVYYRDDTSKFIEVRRQVTA